eukprot:760140-Hanusia_phi.AAC.3
MPGADPLPLLAPVCKAQAVTTRKGGVFMHAFCIDHHALITTKSLQDLTEFKRQNSCFDQILGNLPRGADG